MLAAVFGRDEIVSLLLAAGADVRLKDRLGLTATEWSVRRGFSNIAQLIANASTPKLPIRTNETTGAIHLEAHPEVHPEGHSAAHVQTHHATEAIRGQTAVETETASQRDGSRTEDKKARLGAAGLAMLRARAAAQVAEFDTEAETARRQTTLGQSHAPGTDEGTRTETLEPATAEEESTSTQSETIKLRIELDRIFEESRRRVEEEIAQPSERTQTFNQTVPANQPAPLTIPAAVLAPTAPPAALANKSDEPRNVKRCPKCHTVYKNTVLVYCPRDTTRLWTVEGPSLKQLPAHASGRPMLWVMIAITLTGAAFATYRLTNYSFQTAPPTPAVATKTEQPKVAAVKRLPAVGGALVGAELNVPDPEYPTVAAGKRHSDGISGTVTVQVQVNRKGKVISTHVLNGEWALRAAATKAAKKATFAVEKLGGNGSVVTGTITYNFVAPQTEPPATAGSPAASPAAAESRTTTGSSVANEEDLPVTGDALAGAEINLPKAEYPESARRRRVSGTITVTVRVNRAGKVISWLTSSGDSRLRAAALKAAKKATFAPEKLPGKGEVVGTITYNFKL
jgi:TonB family protein